MIVFTVRFVVPDIHEFGLVLFEGVSMTVYGRDKRAWLKGLVMACPFGAGLPDCPLSDIRHKPSLERLNWVNLFDDRSVDTILSHHKKCLETRERDLMP